MKSHAMRFVVTAASGATCERLGALTTRAGQRLLTPCAALLTQAGSVPHVTREVLERALPEPQLMLSPLSSCLHLESGAKSHGGGLAQFCGSRSNDAWLVTTDDVSVEIPVGHFERDVVPLWTRRGKVLVDPDRYMDLMCTFRPDAYVALADTRAYATAPRKRLRKAVARSNAALDVCVRRHKQSETLSLQSSLMGAVVGWGCAESVERSVAHVATHSSDLCGVLLAGLATPHGTCVSAPEDLPAQLPHALVCQLSRLLLYKSQKGLESGLVRVVPGRWSPACAAALVLLGCDVLDTSAAQRLADSGRALVFPYTEDALKQLDAQQILDLDDDKYAAELTPLVAGCTCATCTRHTRAYVHHLRRTRELLAPVLLTLHNVHHYGAFFSEMRRQVAAGALPRYSELVAQHHTRYVAQHPRDQDQADQPADVPREQKKARS